MWYDLVCAIANHEPPFLSCVGDGSRCRIQNATISQLLEDLAEEHHVACGCCIQVGNRAWMVSLPVDKVLDGGAINAPSSDSLPLDTPLDAISSGTSPPVVHILVSGERSPTTDYVALYRRHSFLVHRYRNASVMTRTRGEFPGSTSLPPTLPPADLNDYDRMCSLDFPGLVFADKSESLRAVLSQFASSRINILRRPKGFGKTTFLSMLAAFFDAYSPRAYFPFVLGGQDMSARPFDAHKRLLILSLDLAEINPDGQILGEYEACERLMSCAAERFLVRYQKVFAEDQAVKAGTLIPSFLGILGLLRRHGWKLFVTIDNYTSPIIHHPRSRYDEAISRLIFHFVEELVSTNQIAYTMIVGEDLSHHLEWASQSWPFVDLSDEPSFADAIGFTPDEVTALGEIVSVDVLRELPPTSSELPGTRLVYAAAHVVSVARDLMETGRRGPPEEYPFQVLFVRPPEFASASKVSPDDQSCAADGDASPWNVAACSAGLWTEGINLAGPGCDGDESDSRLPSLSHSSSDMSSDHSATDSEGSLTQPTPKPDPNDSLSCTP